MKEELEKILQNNNWYKVSKLKDLKASCCPESELEVLDGDFIKDKFANQLNNYKEIFMSQWTSI